MEKYIFDKITSYSNGKMNAQQAKVLKLVIEQNPKLAKTVSNHSVANDNIELLIEDNLRKELNQYRSNLFLKKK